MNISPPETKPAENPLKTFLQYSAVLLALATALLSLLGWIYGSTYLVAWGLPERLFPLTREGAVISGFLSILMVFVKNISYVAYGVVVLAVVMIATMVSCYRPLYELLNNRLRKIFLPMKGHVVITDAHDGIMDRLAALAGGCFQVMCLLWGVAALCVWVGKQADERAARERAAMRSGQASAYGMPHRARLHVGTDARGFVVYSGHMIETSATHAALYTVNRGMVILPLAQIAKIEINDRPKAYE